MKFWKADKGWGAIASAELPPGEDAFVLFSRIEGVGFRDLAAGDLVEFEPVPTVQDSFRWIVERVRVLEHGPAPTLRRHGDRVEIVRDGTPDTPLLRRSGA